MKLPQLILITLMFMYVACEPEPDGPETDCSLLFIYDLDYHTISAPKVFDIRTIPPTEIRNGKIENVLYDTWQDLTDAGLNPPPYNHYFIYTAFFNEPDSSRLHFTNVDFFDYTFERNDCLIDFFLPGDTLQAELVDGGSEITFERYAIYYHGTTDSGADTFTFKEFRIRDFKSFEEIAYEFAKDNAGEYDTIGIEMVSSRTRE